MNLAFDCAICLIVIVLCLTDCLIVYLSLDVMQNKLDDDDDKQISIVIDLSRSYPPFTKIWMS